MGSDGQGGTDGGLSLLALTPGEAAVGPPSFILVAGSTQSPTPAATGNAESAALNGANSRVERVRRMQYELRRGKPLVADYPVWDYYARC